MPSLHSSHAGLGMAVCRLKCSTEHGPEGNRDKARCRCGVIAEQLWALAFILCLVGTSAGPLPRRLDLCSEADLSHLAMDQTSPKPYSLIFASINLATILPIFLCANPQHYFLVTSPEPTSELVQHTCVGPTPGPATKLSTKKTLGMFFEVRLCTLKPFISPANCNH